MLEALGDELVAEAINTPPSDESLVTAVLNGNRQTAYGELVRRYERAVRGVCLAILRDDHLASDAAQDAFLAAYRSLASLRDRGSFGMWLTTIARNRAIRYARMRPQHGALPSSLAQPTPEKHDFELLSAVQALPEHERVVIMLRYFDDHDIPAIAAMLGRPIGTVTKQISRAHRRLRRTLAERKSL
jgi:RNA polymerase sigma-70 factor (ECF subfamily)